MQHDIWILDSGASHHMTSRRDWLVDFEEHSCDILSAKGTIKAVGRGRINISYFNGSNWKIGELQDEVYVPELEKNVFSQNHALDQGPKIEASSRNCKMMTKDNNVIMVGIRKGPLTIIQIIVRPTITDKYISANLAQGKSTLKMWHESLAHQNLVHIRSFLKQNGITFVDTRISTVSRACLGSSTKNRSRIKRNGQQNVAKSYTRM